MLRPLTPAPWEPLTHPFRWRSLGVLPWAFLFAPLKDHHLPGLLSEAPAPSLLAQPVPGLFRTPFVHLDTYTALPAAPPFFTQTGFAQSLSDFHPRLLWGQAPSHTVYVASFEHLAQATLGPGVQRVL